MSDPENTARIFSQLMLQGKVNAALRLLSHDENGSVLSLDDLIAVGIGQQTTRDALMEKQPSTGSHSTGHKPNQSLS